MWVRQAKRVETLVVMLNALLRRWVEGDEQGFKVDALASLTRAWTPTTALLGTDRVQLQCLGC